MIVNKKLLKCECGKLAVWTYMPASDYYGHYCDDCVPRGCTCNWAYSINEEHPELIELPPVDDPLWSNTWKWLDEARGCWCHIDEKGREYPCCEYWSDKDGYEFDEEYQKYFESKNIEYFV